MDGAPNSTAEPMAALLTPRGRGAVATVSFVGDCGLIDVARPPLFRAANDRPLGEQEIGRIVFGWWGEEPSEEVVVCRVGESTLEINCHGGDAAARRILNHLESTGCVVISWSEWLVRTHGRLEAELVEALALATTLRTAAILLEQSSGLLRNELLELRRMAGEPEDGNQWNALRTRLDSLVGWAEFGRHLTRPWSVVLAGRPNVGKSSLINALVGFERSIVFDQPGTTRDVVTAETALDGWPVRLSDTAGLRAGADALESAGIDRAREQLAAADCRVLLLDTSRPPEELDLRLLGEWPDALVVAHKCDLPDVWGATCPAHALRVSSLTREGVDELAAAIVWRLVPAVPAPGTAIPVTERQVRLLSEARSALHGGDADAVRGAIESCFGS